MVAGIAQELCRRLRVGQLTMTRTDEDLWKAARALEETMTRTDELLRKAAQTFEDQSSPFEHYWLVANGVTLDECGALSESIGLAIKVYLEVMRMGIADDYPGRQLSALILANVVRDEVRGESQR